MAQRLVWGLLGAATVTAGAVWVLAPFAATDVRDTATAAQPVTVTMEPPAPVTDPPPAEAATAQPDPAPVPPVVDVLRVEPDGSGLIAGAAAPGTTVAVQVDGETVATAQADSGGQYVAFLDLGASDLPRSLTLESRDAGGVVPSDGAVLLAPVAPVMATPEEATDPADPEGEGSARAADPVASVNPGDAAQANAGGPATPPADTIPDVLVIAPAGLAPDAPAATLAVPLAGPDAAPVTVPVGQITSQAPDEAPTAAPSGAAVTLTADVPDGGAAPAPDAAPRLDVRPPVLLSDARGVRVLTPVAAPDAAAVAQTTVALDTISYNAAGEVFVGGRAPGAGMVRIYLDNVAVAADRVEDGQWDAGLPDVPPGRYTIRVDQLADDGTVLSRVESPFQRESTAALAAVMADQTGAGFGGVAVKTVQPGHTLWAIARERYGDGVMYVNLFEANRAAIADPDLIYPGQVFVLPEIAAASAP